MKVRCIKLMTDSGEPISSSDWLKLNQIYLVIELFVRNGQALRFRVVTQDGTPGYQRAEQFELVSDYIPKGWCVSLVGGSFFHLGPRAWSKPEFWDQYFDSDK